MKRTPLKRGKPPNKRSKSPKAKMKVKAWTQYSIFIRQRDADADGIVACVTCGDLKHWKQGDAGHFLGGRTNANLFEERGVHFQCKPCNGGFKQKIHINIPEAYKQYIIERYGESAVDELVARRKETVQYTIKDFEEIYEKYKALNDIRG